MTQYKPYIGLEVHAELKTKSKMFCGCVNDPFSAKKPNIYTCPVCLGLPGALPVPNHLAIEWTIKLGLALDCQINQFSKFDRKNYFYPDLAKGYQISQYDIPFCFDGEIETSQGKIRIRRIHLEEDTGKLIHDTVDGKSVSLIDFNRSGVPLAEIVTEPDIKNGEQAKEYGKNLRQIMRFLKISDCKMAEGGMRLEANVSLAKINDDQLPSYKVEVKNINSFRFLEEAINYEIKRQAKILDKGEIPNQETRGWDADKKQTFSQRSKEEAEDYRYFPDPDIPPIKFTNEQITKIKNSLPELPKKIVKRWETEYQLKKKSAELLSGNQEQVEWAESIFKLAQKNKIHANDVANDIINKKIKVQTDNTAEQIITAFTQLHQTASVDETQLDEIIKQVLTENQEAVIKYQSGKTQVLGFLMGQVMSKLKEKVDPNQVRQALIDQLKN